jgi:hypothetical protein
VTHGCPVDVYLNGACPPCHSRFGKQRKDANVRIDAVPGNADVQEPVVIRHARLDQSRNMTLDRHGVRLTNIEELANAEPQCGGVVITKRVDRSPHLHSRLARFSYSQPAAFSCVLG